MVKIKRALISVYDKANLTELVKGLKEFGVDIISTGGTSDFIKSQGVAVKGISELTGFPEILEGRVKTLHPKVHGALLSLRESHLHMQEARSHGIEMIDMVVVNLYPFTQVIAKPDVKLEEALEYIDIGGVSLLRSAAKNYRSVAVMCKPSQYATVLEQLKAHRGLIMDELLSSLAVEAFSVTAEYDKSINAYLGSRIVSRPQVQPVQPQPVQVVQPAQPQAQSAQPQPAQPQPVQPQSMPVQVQPAPPQAQPVQPQVQPVQPQPAEASLFPEIFNISLKKIKDLRYGENPHQKASFYKDPDSKEASICSARQLYGKELSFNNIMDMDAALEIVRQFDKPAVSIIKHTNPCGVATADTLAKAFIDALECDKMSAFGSIIGLNKPVDVNTADAILSSGFVECIIAPSFDNAALDKFKTKINLRILEVPSFNDKQPPAKYRIRQIEGGALIQTKDTEDLDTAQLRIVTKKKPTAEEADSLIFAWKVVKYVKSNAIVLAKDTKTVGIGAGQMSRVDAVFIATQKASRFSRGAVLASDAFFPKPDGIETASRAGVVAIIQPGGSKADEEIIRLADKRGLSMVFTGIRHFCH